MRTTKESKYSALLIEYGFVEITDLDVSTRVQEIFSYFIQRPVPFFVASTEETFGTMETAVFDPLWGQVWSKEAHIDLSYYPFRFTNMTRQAFEKYQELERQELWRRRE